MNLESNKNRRKISETVSLYETSLRNGASTYFCEHDFIDIIAHYEESDRVEDALLAIDIALEFHTFSIDFYILKASLLLELFKPLQALECIKEGKALGYEQSDLYLLEAESYMLINDMEMAIKAVNVAKTLEQGYGLTEVFFCEALIFEHFQLYNGCFDSLKKALLCDPLYQPALNKIWWCTEITERYEESCAIHLQIIDKKPYNSKAWFNLGHAYSCMGENEKSIDAFEYAFIINPKFEFAYRDCAEMYIREDKYFKALQCYSEVLEFIAPDSDILSKCAYCHTRLGDFRKANDYYFKSIALNPDNDTALFGLAANLYQLGEYNQASRMLAKAIGIDRSREEYMLLQAAIAVEKNEHALAISSFERAIEMAPENELCWIKFFLYHMLERNYSKALDLIEEGEFYHENGEFTTAKIVALFCCGKKRQAQNLLFKSLEEGTFDEKVFYNYKPEELPDYLLLMTN